jgi:2-alkenal reductase
VGCSRTRDRELSRDQRHQSDRGSDDIGRVRGRTFGRGGTELRFGRVAGGRRAFSLAAHRGWRSADLQVGQEAFAIGNPYGLEQTLTSGIISALHRRLPTATSHEISGVIQTDAPINPGNSGGPLLDSAGRLIGVNSAIISGSGASAGIGFAIPVDVVNRIAGQLIRDGRVPVPGIGIVAASEGEATRLGIDGIIIVRTLPQSPAAKAGLEGAANDAGVVQDVITVANGQPVHSMSDLADILEEVGVGKTVKRTVARDGQSRSVDVPVADISEQSQG